MSHRSLRDGGYSYLEVLMAIVILAISIVPAMDALTAGIRGAQIHSTLSAEHYHVFGRLEELLAQPFDDLDAEAVAVSDPSVPTSYSDTLGAPRRRLVYLSRYDGDDADTDANPFTGVDPGLIWVRVQIEGRPRSLETLTTP